MKFLVESEFQGQEPPRTQETTKTTGTIRIPRVGFGTDRPYIALFWDRPSKDLQQGLVEKAGREMVDAGIENLRRNTERNAEGQMVVPGRSGKVGRKKRAI